MARSPTTAVTATPAVTAAVETTNEPTYPLPAPGPSSDDVSGSQIARAAAARPTSQAAAPASPRNAVMMPASTEACMVSSQPANTTAGGAPAATAIATMAAAPRPGGTSGARPATMDRANK